MKELQKKITKNALVENEDNDTSFLEWTFKTNDQTAKNKLDTIQFSDGRNLNADNINKTLKKSFGTTEAKTVERILKKAASGLSASTFDQRINEASCLLSALEPKSPAEALLLSQFLALNDSGMKCLSLANQPDQGFYHVERLFTLAHKLLNTANQTMQTVLKYRAGGQQTLQVIHVHNEGQAIVAQNVSPLPRE